MSNKHIGSSFDSFLEEKGILNKVESIAKNKVKEYQTEEAIISIQDTVEKLVNGAVFTGAISRDMGKAYRENIDKQIQKILTLSKDK